MWLMAILQNHSLETGLVLREHGQGFSQPGFGNQKENRIKWIRDGENRHGIDFFTVYDAILAGGQTRLKLQLMYGILAHLEPL